jgi:hypothetical protein
MAGSVAPTFSCLTANLIFWMMTRNPMERPTIQEVIRALAFEEQLLKAENNTNIKNMFFGPCCTPKRSPNPINTIRFEAMVEPVPGGLEHHQVTDDVLKPSTESPAGKYRGIYRGESVLKGQDYSRMKLTMRHRTHTLHGQYVDTTVVHRRWSLKVTSNRSDTTSYLNKDNAQKQILDVHSSPAIALYQDYDLVSKTLLDRVLQAWSRLFGTSVIKLSPNDPRPFKLEQTLGKGGHGSNYEDNLDRVLLALRTMHVRRLEPFQRRQKLEKSLKATHHKYLTRLIGAYIYTKN